MYIALNRGHRVLPRHAGLNGGSGIDHLFDNFFNAAGARAEAGAGSADARSDAAGSLAARFDAAGSLAARFDVVERSDRYVAQIEIPGVAKDEIDVQIDGATVRVKAEPKVATTDAAADPAPAVDEGRVLHSTRTTRAWLRNFTLPAEVDEARAEAAYQDGVLTLTLPKKEVAQPKRLQIR